MQREDPCPGPYIAHLWIAKAPEGPNTPQLLIMRCIPTCRLPCKQQGALIRMRSSIANPTSRIGQHANKLPSGIFLTVTGCLGQPVLPSFLGSFSSSDQLPVQLEWNCRSLVDMDLWQTLQTRCEALGGMTITAFRCF